MEEKELMIADLLQERENLNEQIKMLKRSNKNYKENYRHRSNRKFTKLKNELQAYKDKEDKLREILPLDLAIYFHETYERLAPSFGYETREETKQFDNNSKNGMLMVAVCEVILNKLLQILNKEER